MLSISFSRNQSIFYLSLLSLTFASCNNKSENTFQGDKHAIEQAHIMFEAIGGLQKWCELSALYVKAKHWENDINGPYTSEIWREIDSFNVQIEQKHQTFHVRASINNTEGKVSYLDHRDTFRLLNNFDLLEWEHEHKHNVYVALHNIACSPSKYTASLDDNAILNFHHGNDLYCKVKLDDKYRPFIYFTPDYEGNLTYSIFTEWGKDGGLIHSAGGHPMDSSFIYRTEIWEPTFKSNE
ncbi:MAG: hypothetical protein HKN92_10190 [Chitinophagales bacterium]|nr:hypothetical protein [Chitinophagales bacterium]